MRLVICLLLFAIVGCKPLMRYGGNVSETPSQATQSVSNRSTDATIELGQILQSYLGKPYAGSSKYDPGLDCSLFTSEVFKKFANMKLPRTAKDQFGVGKMVDRHDLRFGDLVFFKTDSKRISHVGVYVGHDEFIHASSSNGVMISELNEKYWAKRYVGARDILD